MELGCGGGNHSLLSTRFGVVLESTGVSSSLAEVVSGVMGESCISLLSERFLVRWLGEANSAWIGANARCGWFD